MSTDFGAYARDTSVLQFLEPIQKFLDAEGVTDVAVNSTGVVFVEDNLGWHRHTNHRITETWFYDLANAVAAYSDQRIDANNPIMSAQLPAGERAQFLMPSVVERGRAALIIRVPDSSIRSMDEYIAGGLFSRVLWDNPVHKQDNEKYLPFLSKPSRILLDHLENNRVAEFFLDAVRLRQNMGLVGDTGSGKTSFMKMLCSHIPKHQRLGTIENVRELFVTHKGADIDLFENRVSMLYSAGGQGKAQVTVSNLLASANRSKFSRLLLAELLGGEAYEFLNLLTGGHEGSMTTWHSTSTGLAPKRFGFMAREHSKGMALTEAALNDLFFQTIDIVAHMKADLIFDDEGNVKGKERGMTQIYFDPIKKFLLQNETSASIDSLHVLKQT